MKTLPEKIKEIRFDHTDMVDGYNTLCDEDINQLLPAFREYVEEVIGEDDDMRLIEKGENYDVFDGDAKSVKERNQLRAEQRKRLSLLGGR